MLSCSMKFLLDQNYIAFEIPEDTDGINLGDLITAGPCVSSHFGDTKLTFYHEPIENDIELRPEWTKAYAENCFCNIPK